MTGFYSGAGIVVIQGGGGSGGADGVGIANANINDKGELVLYLTNGTIKNVGRVVGADGKPGVDGLPGKDGVTFIPTITTDGVLSWSNNGNLPNPPDINLLEGDIWNDFSSGSTEPPKNPAELDKSEWVEF